MGFLYHYTTILHMLSTFFPFFPPKPAPLHSWQTNPCTRYLQSWRTGWAQTQVTALKYFMVFAKGDFCKSVFLPGWMFRQRSKKIIDQSYQEERVPQWCGKESTESPKGGMGNEDITYSKFDFISPLSSVERETSFLYCLFFCSTSLLCLMNLFLACICLPKRLISKIHCFKAFLQW